MESQGIVNPAVNMQENPWVTGINTAGNVAGAILPFFSRTTGGPNTTGLDYYGGQTSRPGHESIPIGVRTPYGTGGPNFADVPQNYADYGQSGQMVYPWWMQQK
jgi:hypothetical protein